MYCRNCGQKIPDDARFCERCGNSVFDSGKENPSRNQKPSRTPRNSGRKGRKGIIICLALVLACVLGAGGYFWYSQSAKGQQPEAGTAVDSDAAVEIQEAMAKVYEVACAFEDENGLVPESAAEAAIDAVYRAAKDKPGVVSCEKDENGVFIDTEEGFDYVYSPEIAGVDSGGSSLDIVTMQPYYTKNKGISPNVDHEALDICAGDVSSFDTRWRFQNQNDLNDDAVTMERILKLDDFKMILWQGHGGYTKKSGFYLCTTIHLTSDLLKEYPCITPNNTVLSLDGELRLKSAFFQENYPENAFDNAFIYLATCLSGKDRELTDILLSKGAAVIFVNSETINRGYNLDMLHLIVESFCLGGTGTVSQNAMSELGDGYSFNTPENWSIYDSLRFAKQVYGETDPHHRESTEVYYIGKPGVDNLTYAQWMDGFGDLSEPEQPEQSEQPDVPPVADAWTGSADYYTTDEHGKDVQKTAEYAIPKFTLDSPEIDAINNAIMETLSEAVDDSTREFPDRFSLPRYGSITYSWAVHGDIVSLLIYVPELSIDWAKYYVYNVSLTEKRGVTKEEVISAAGMSMQDYNQLVREALGSEFWDQAGPALSGGNLPAEAYPIYQSLLQDTISDENIAKASPLFNKEGQLCAAGTYGVDAGGGTVWTVVNLEDFTLSPYYAEEIVVPDNTQVVSTMYIVNVDAAAYFRGSPNEQSDNIICTIPLNAEVGFIETTNSVFSRVKYNNTYGYVKSEYLGSSPEPVVSASNTADKLGQLALAYYERHYGIRPSHMEITDNEDGTFTIHLFDIVDNGDEAHTATYAWYTVNEDGLGTDDLFMTPINLNY